MFAVFILICNIADNVNVVLMMLGALVMIVYLDLSKGLVEYFKEKEKDINEKKGN
jgi:hypothetical protein